MGSPTAMASSVEVRIIEMVFIVSSHIPKAPIRQSVRMQATTILALRLAPQAMAAMAIRIIGQGVLVSRFSDQTRKWRRGSNRLSMASP